MTSSIKSRYLESRYDYSHQHKTAKHSAPNNNNRIADVANNTFRYKHPSQSQIEINKTLTSRNITQIRFFETLDKLESFNEVNIATFWHNLAKHKSEWHISFKDQCLDKIKNRTNKILGELGGRELANISWAFANFGCKDIKFIESLIKAIEPNLQKDNFFNHQEFANISWAFAKFGCKDNRIIESLIKAIEHNLQKDNFFKAQDLANIS